MAKYTKYIKIYDFVQVPEEVTYERQLYINEYITTTNPVQVNSSLQCTVMVSDFALAPQWLPVDCERKFRHMLFVCESTLTDIRKKDVLKNLLLQKHVCPISYTAIRVTGKTHT